MFGLMAAFSLPGAFYGKDTKILKKTFLTME